ncbi:Transcriptional regulator, contains XRE-family HTH domain [Asanoa hainanensis]|uniref:Transcriptional regulator, contains XRE-family HTH domain n=1 Tax=Asanoa hainanensis TaxID=560556 RepID=A0A239MP46_9ACTN|nr:helix-turn-helix transcriptional regulator [Asanoa hainanensis]SNT44491.1 Transcriptional regulator, contains XRE-family HTH domain [Asanoa hainanensis]
MAGDSNAMQTLAARLRALRAGERQQRVTQHQLARALGVSVPLISSWERAEAAPPVERIAAYAHFFATPRSVQDGQSALRDDLSAEELGRRQALKEELTALRAAAVGVPGVAQVPAALDNYPPAAGPWGFADGTPVTIVCGELPAGRRADAAYSDPDSPDYVDLYRFADVDSLVELHGYVRAANPRSEVGFTTASLVTRDHLTTHLVLLGGVDFNDVITPVLDSLGVPVRQHSRLTDDPDDEGAFEVRTTSTEEHRPALTADRGHRVLVEDVAHFCRGPNPYNVLRTVTVCNGMFGRGVYGAVRALTDARFRDRNAVYVRNRFAQAQTYSILARVKVVNGEVITPDWTLPDTILHEWSK